MSVYKEEIRYLEDLAVRQVQIYPDAADRGIKVDGVKDPIFLKVKELLDGEFPVVGLIALKKDRYLWGNRNSSWGYDVNVRIPWEMDHGHYSGTEVVITYTEDPLRKVNFLSIRFHPFRSAISPFKKPV